jgi:serine/threonine protein kinase
VSSATEFIGQVLHQRYRIDRQLGQKTGRRTFLAIDLHTELPVVIKLLIFNNEFIWDDLKLFEREAETLKHLDLPSIPRYLDYFEFDLPQLRGFALVQTYIDAPSLEEAVSGGRRFTDLELRELATSILDILDYLHSLQPPTIHRDLKPSNILLTNRSGNSIGDVYLVDFGSVQNMAIQDGGTMTVVGTYGYMPLEQFGGKTVPASDLYSLGATLIYTITGTHPAELPQEDGQIQLPANLSNGWQCWLKKAIAPSLKNRFPDVKAAKLALGQLDESEIITTEKPYGSTLILTKNADSIEITSQDRRYPLSWGIVVVWSLFILPLTSNLLALIVFLPLQIKIAYSFFHLCQTFAPLLPIIYNFVYYLFVKIQVRIDNETIGSYYKLGRIQFPQNSSSPRSRIDRLQYHHMFQSKGKKQVEAIKEVIIAAGVKEYRINCISETEAEWLLAKLSEYLNLPIAKHRDAEQYREQNLRSS